MASPLLISITFFCLIGAAGMAIYGAFFSGNKVIEERFGDLAIKMRIAQGVFEDDDEKEPENLSGMLLRLALKRLPAPKLNSPKTEKMSQTLKMAGFRAQDLPVYYLIRIAAGVLLGSAALLTSWFLGSHGNHMLLWTVAGASVGSFIPASYLGRRARKRQADIARQLSDVLDLLVVCVESGLGLFEAIKVVGKETLRQKQEIGRELSLATTDIAAGATLGQALRAMGERTAVEDIKPLAATLIQSEQLGAQIAPALRSSSDALRTRRRLTAEEAAQKSSIKMLFPLVLFVLPAMIMVIIGPAILQILRTING